MVSRGSPDVVDHDRADGVVEGAGHDRGRRGDLVGPVRPDRRRIGEALAIPAPAPTVAVGVTHVAGQHQVVDAVLQGRGEIAEEPGRGRLPAPALATGGVVIAGSEPGQPLTQVAAPYPSTSNPSGTVSTTVAS